MMIKHLIQLLLVKIELLSKKLNSFCITWFQIISDTKYHKRCILNLRAPFCTHLLLIQNFIHPFRMYTLEYIYIYIYIYTSPLSTLCMLIPQTIPLFTLTSYVVWRAHPELCHIVFLNKFGFKLNLPTLQVLLGQDVGKPKKNENLITRKQKPKFYSTK
jgi:hypothetical protein